MGCLSATVVGAFVGYIQKDVSVRLSMHLDFHGQSSLVSKP